MSDTGNGETKYIIQPGDLRRDGRPSRAEFTQLASAVDALTAVLTRCIEVINKQNAIVWGIVKKLDIKPEELQAYADDMGKAVDRELEQNRVDAGN